MAAIEPDLGFVGRPGDEAARGQALQARRPFDVGEARLDREAPDTVDLTIVLGRDVLGDADTEGTPGSTAPESSGS